jgi:hypothetical protein
MQKLAPTDLYTLETYARERPAFRAHVLAHKQTRNVQIGPHLTLLFEDRLTVQYQVQEMLRIERTFEAAGIQDELDAYNPLIPDGTNLKATMLIEYADAAERAQRLMELHGIEHRVVLHVGTQAPITAIADEDLDRSTEQKTSAVHFLRFEFTTAHVSAFKAGAQARLVVDHPRYHAEAELVPRTLVALAADLN